MIEKLLKAVVSDDAISDLHLTVNSKPIVRYAGKLRIYSQSADKLSFNDMQQIARTLMNEEQWAMFNEDGELDFSYSVPGFSRFRVNAFYQRGAISIAFRVIPSKIPKIEELGLPPVLKKLALQRRGLILCTGATGSGKSTTLAAMIEEINENRQCHILTLEDPIEYLHHHKKCIVHQREVGIDTQSFANGLRSALRQDPDIILVGEMRDLETISIALEAAETGHLVFATLHTNDAPGTVGRIIDVFPAHQQQQVSVQLAATLNGIISQQLLPRSDGKGRVAAMELLIGTPAVRNIIRESKPEQLESVMQTGGKFGMIVMDNYLVKLYEEGLVELEVILRRSNNPEYVKKRISRMG
ncbi:MAG: type IV pilus twitching motility protein PilT [Halothermotrichaceae bacterium]